MPRHKWIETNAMVNGRPLMVARGDGTYVQTREKGQRVIVKLSYDELSAGSPTLARKLRALLESSDDTHQNQTETDLA